MKNLMVLVITVLLLLPSCLQADTPGMEVVVLGSGGPRAFGRAGSSFIIVLDGVPRILMDVGPGAFLRMGELGLKLEKVDRVLLSHLHIDHCGDLPAFLNDRALTARGPISYRIFGPDSGGQFPKTSRFLDLIIGDNGAFPYQKTFGVPESFTVRDLPTNLNSSLSTIIDENGLVIEEIATHHDGCPSVGYRISYKGVTLVYSGDMDASALPNLVQLAKDANLLIFNCAVLDPPGSPQILYTFHTPPHKIGEAARDSKVKNLLLSHLAPDVERQEEAVRKSIGESYPGPVIFASDKMRVTVGN